MPPLKKWIEVLPSEVVDGLLTSCNGLLKASLEVLADFANLFGNLEPAAVVIPAPPSSSEFGVQLMTSRKGVEETSKRGWGEIVRRGVSSTDCCCSSIYAWNLAVPKLIFKIGREKKSLRNTIGLSKAKSKWVFLWMQWSIFEHFWPTIKCNFLNNNNSFLQEIEIKTASIDTARFNRLYICYGLLCFKQSNSSCCSSDLVFGISRNNLRASLSHTMRPASSCNIVNFCTFVSERYENSSCCYCCSWCLYTML